jgi:hypothetical protein
MVTVRGVNVFPAGVENIIRKFAEVDEFRITVNKVKQMDEMDIEVELCEGADPRWCMKSPSSWIPCWPSARACTTSRATRPAALRDEGQALPRQALFKPWNRPCLLRALNGRSEVAIPDIQRRS